MIRPIDDIVIVKAEAGYSGPLAIANHKQHVGRVMAVGPGQWRKAANGDPFRVAPEVKEGDRILFSFRAGMEEKVDGEEVLIMREGDIMGVLDDDAEVGLTQNRKAWGLDGRA